MAGGGRVLRLAPRPALLAGREELLAELDARLAGGEGAGPRVVALYGLGGAGKTSVAVEYAHRHLAEVGVAWQLPAEDATVLAAGFAELAAQLGAGGTAGAGTRWRRCTRSLAAYPARVAADLRQRPRTGRRCSGSCRRPGDGRVLITSQSAVWPPGQAVEVPVLDTEVAAEFLVNRTGDPDQPGRRRAGGGAGRAAAGAGAGRRLHPGHRDHPGRVPGAVPGPAGGPAGPRRSRRAPGGRGGHLGRWRCPGWRQRPRPRRGCCGCWPAWPPSRCPWPCCSPMRRPPASLHPDVAARSGPLLGDPVAAGDAVAALRRYSLVTPAGDGLVLVHRLVQAVTLAQMPADVAGQWEQAAAALVEAAIPADPRLPAAWPVCAVLLPHARAVLDLTSDGMWRIAQYLGYSGSYPAARDLFQLIADAHREDDAYGPEHPDTLAARDNLAHWTGEAGDAAGARDQYAALLPIHERVLGPEHPDTLTARGNLACWTGEAGDAAGARDQYAALLPIDERVLGPEHPDTLTARANLARWTGEAGDAAGARDQYAALLPIRERVLGPEHPDTLTARANLARWTGEAGDAAGARDQFAALLPIRERVLGPEHPDTLTARGNLARWTGEAGDAAGARDQFAALLPIRERVLGPEHPDTLATRGNLARWTGEAGDAAAARDQSPRCCPSASGCWAPSTRTPWRPRQPRLLDRGG